MARQLNASGTMTLTEALAHLSHTHTASADAVSRSYASCDMPAAPSAHRPPHAAPQTQALAVEPLLAAVLAHHALLVVLHLPEAHAARNVRGVEVCGRTSARAEATLQTHGATAAARMA